MSQATALLKLQDTDVKLLRLASTLAKMPQQARLKTIELARKKTTSELTGIVGQRKDAQIEVDDLVGMLDHYKEKTVEVQLAADAAQTHRELKSFEQQLTSLAKHTEKAEYQLGPARQKLAKLELAEKNAHLMLERLEAERERTQASLDEDSADLKRQIIELDRERKAAAAELSDDQIAEYESARKRFGGLAVERLHGNVPSICRVKLQPSSFHDLKNKGEVARCPYCHRILITTEDEA